MSLPNTETPQFTGLKEDQYLEIIRGLQAQISELTAQIKLLVSSSSSTLPSGANLFSPSPSHPSDSIDMEYTLIQSRKGKKRRNEASIKTLPSSASSSSLEDEE